jgi:PD-(D/E)XK endonuclease
MAPLKQKGDLAELMIAADLRSQGHRVAFPFGEDAPYDLVVDRDDRLERVQVKHATSDGKTVVVRCYSQSLSGGRVRSTSHYTHLTIDWLAVFDCTTRRCFYVPAVELGTGRTRLHLRLTPCSYNRTRDVRPAERYERMEPAGIEPATSCLQSRRSPS